MSQVCVWPGLGMVAQKIFGFKLCLNDSSPISYRIFQNFMDHSFSLKKFLNYIYDTVMTQSETPAYSATVLQVLESGKQVTM
jgi:hypothetical protein